MIVRNEAVFLGLTLRAALKWCDVAVVLLHACTDSSADIVRDVQAEHPERVLVLSEPSPDAWAEMIHRQRTLEAARCLGATHCAVVDADEVLTSNLLSTVRNHIQALAPGQFIGIPLRNICDSLYTYRSDSSIWGTSGTMLAFANHPALSWQSRNGYQHHHRSPYGSKTKGDIVTSGGVMHLQFVSRRRLVAKHAWYKMMERVNYPAESTIKINAKYNMAVDRKGLQTSPTPADWWQGYESLIPYLNLDLAPWHEEECRRLLEKHKRAMFAGLELFGVV